jgi:hypothetical protein
MQYTKGLRVADPDEVRTIFLVFFTVFEPLRLLAAYQGNLLEKVVTQVHFFLNGCVCGCTIA